MLTAYVFCLISLLIALAIPVLGTRLLRRHSPRKTLEEHKEVAGFIYATIGVLYSVVLGFSVVMTSERYSASAENTDSEAATLTVIRNLASGLPQNDQTKLASLLTNYCDEVTGKEWPQMIRGIAPSMNSDSLMALQGQILAIKVNNPGESAIFQQVLQNLDSLQKLRAKRLAVVDDHLVGIVWLALITGGLISIAFCFLFAAQHQYLQIIMTGALTLIILINIDVIYALQGPYRGDVHIVDGPFRSARQSISR